MTLPSYSMFGFVHLISIMQRFVRAKKAFVNWDAENGHFHDRPNGVAERKCTAVCTVLFLAAHLG